MTDRWGMKTPCPTCGSEGPTCGSKEVENTKGVKMGLIMPFVHLERLWHVTFSKLDEED